jgi:hypothetical protein
MPFSVPFPTGILDQRITAGDWCRPNPFPVARTIGGVIDARHVHLVDGDGASLCEGFARHQLERLELPWQDVVTGARCRVCEVLGP